MRGVTILLVGALALPVASLPLVIRDPARAGFGFAFGLLILLGPLGFALTAPDHLVAGGVLAAVGVLMMLAHPLYPGSRTEKLTVAGYTYWLVWGFLAASAAV